MSGWVPVRPRVSLSPRRDRGRNSMSLQPHPFTRILTLIWFSVLCIAGTTGQTPCNVTTECAAPEVSGGGSVTFSPSLACYNDGANVNVSCSGFLYGVATIGPCVAESSWVTDPLPTCEESSCPALSAPDYGSIDPDPATALYDEITYSCDDGWFLDGPSMAVCTGTGEWSPSSSPSCSGNCTLPTIMNGFVDTYSSDLHEGSQIAIACDEGYTLTGVENVTCHDGEWDPDVGECLADCSSPNISNSDFDVDRGDTNHGNYIIVTCDEGFTSGTGANVSEPMTCGDGDWDVDIYCHANCPVLAAPTDGSISRATGPFFHGQSVGFNCSEGFTLTGESTTTCNNGSWSSDVPVCKADCLVPYIAYSNLNDTTSTTYIDHGVSVAVVCWTGFSFGYDSDFDGNLTCDDGSFNDSDVQCLESCPSPSINNSNWGGGRSETIPSGGSITVDCDTGFTSGTGSDQNETLSCSGGIWDGYVDCYENCPDITAPTGGSIYPPSPPFYHNTTAFFNCSESYLLQGEPVLFCDGGSWSGSPPDCKASCEEPDVANASYFGDSPIQHGDFAIVLCDDGFTSGNGDVMNETIYCNDGSYNETVYCYENCPAVPAIDNGVTYEYGPPHFHGDQVNFTCDANYTLDGNSTITCLNGGWSSVFPECKADCSDPGAPLNGSQYNSSFVHGGLIYFACDAGFAILGADFITCNDGNWSDPVPVCREDTLVDLIKLVCDYDSFTVQVPFALLEGMDASELVLEGDTSCTGVFVNGSTPLVEVSSKLDECGTEREEDVDFDGGAVEYYDVYTNRVIAYSASGVVRGPAVDLPLRCTYDRQRTLDAVSYQLKNYTISKSLSDDGKYVYDFLIYDDSSFDEEAAEMPFYVGLNEAMYFGIGLQGGSDELRVSAKRCWATPSPSAMDVERWDLISNSCQTDTTVQFYYDETRALFSVTSFRFQEHDGLVYIHCDVLVCEQENDQCIKPWDDCGGDAQRRRRRRRRRRAAHLGPMSHTTRLRAGPIQWSGAQRGGPYNIMRRGPGGGWNSDSKTSLQTSSMTYIIAISSLGGVCLVLFVTLSVVTRKLLRLTSDRPK